MSVVVRMEMPENCFKCPLHKFGGTCGLLTGITAEERMNIDKRRPSQCPIICSLPDGHGRLVDADALIELMLERKQPLVGADSSKDRYRYMQWISDFNAIKDAKTIVPAESSKEDA